VTRIKLNNELLALKARLDTTIVFVTHSVGESVYLSTRIVVLAAKGGEIVDQIPVDPGVARDTEYRLGPVYSQLSRRASNALRRAMGEDEP
jgi:NitT/TauT family transport system ATP-binding protein